MTLRLEQNIAPANLPVDLNIAKQHLRLDDADTVDDALLTGMVRGATTACERFTNRALISQTWTLWRTAWPRGEDGDDYWEGLRVGAETTLLTPQRILELPRPPLQSIVYINSYDDSDVATTYAATNYFADTAGTPGRIVLRTGASAPNPTRAANGIEIRFVAGYGDYPGDVPEDIRQGIAMLAAWLYENRGDDPIKAAGQVGAKALWQSHRVMTV